MHVAELWRYPVKSMRGERLASASVSAYGIAGDRAAYVADARGQVVTARTAPGLLALAPAIAADGAAAIDGRRWDDPGAQRLVEAAAGAGARLVGSAGPERFDVMPLSVVTDSAVAVLGVDRRRLRPNVVVTGTEGLEERAWAGRYLRIGEVVIGLARLRDRCVMTTFDPDTLDQDPGVLRDVHRRFGGVFALDAWAVADGTIAVGDEVELIDLDERPRRPKLGRNVPIDIGRPEQRT